MTFKKIIIAATLTLSVAAAAFAEEPKNAPAAPGAAPAATAPRCTGRSRRTCRCRTRRRDTRPGSRSATEPRRGS